MKETEIELIKIDGATDIFGGKIYNASFKNNFSDSPSSITINVVNEDGIYEIPKLDANSIQEFYEIKIGEQELGKYSLVKTRTSVSKSGKILELTFFDITMNLDKIYIGLHKKHGIIPRSDEGDKRLKSYSKKDILSSMEGVEVEGDETGRPPFFIQLNDDGDVTPLILMGREFHPCDANRDGYLDFEEDLFQGDGCDPCPNCPEDKYDGSIDRQRCLDLECSEIFEVRYNFKSLLEAIAEFFTQADIDIEIEGQPETNDLYYAQYEGTLREVLKRWSADFSFNFYLENNEGKATLKFIDTKVEADIIGKDELGEEDVISFEETQSVENTQNSGSISLYRQSGERKIYNCSTSVKMDLKPLTLGDLYSDTDEAILGKKQEENDLVSFEDLEISIGLAKYSLAMREHFWWGKMYGADRGREDIVKLQYLGPPEKKSSPTGGGEIKFEVPEKFPKSTLERSSGLQESEGLDSLNPDTLVEVAKERGILQLGSFKALAFFFPTGRNNEPSEIYYNKGTRFGEGEGKKIDYNATVVNDCKKIWKPTPEELDFFASTPIFGNAEIDFEENTFAVETFSRGYFVLASRKDDLLEKIIKNEQRLGSEFIGKFFARQIDITDELNICGYDKYGKKDYSRKNISVRGGGEFYNFTDKNTKKFLESPLFDFGHSQGSVVGKLQEKVQNKTKINIVQDGESAFDEGVIITQVSNNWYPQEGVTNELKAFLDVYEDKKMKQIDINEGNKEEFSKLISDFAPEHINDPNVKLFVVYPDSFSEGFSVERDQVHPSISINSTDSRGRAVSSGCYGDCENNEECFEGEKNSARLEKLQLKLDSLKEHSTLWRAVKREIDGDKCLDNQCVDSNFCQSDEDCGSFDTIDGETFSEYECVEGECIEKLGLQSSICTRLDLNGFKIYSPPHGFKTPSGKKLLFNEDFDARTYRSILEYQKNVEVFVPKVEHIIQDNIEKFEKGFSKFNVNLYQVPIDDLNLFYRKELATQVCTPSDELLEKLHEDFNLNLSYNIEQPRKSIKISLAGVSKQLGEDMIAKGLESFDINISADGVTSNYVFGNRIMQPVSVDVTRRLVDILQKRTTKHLNYTQSVLGIQN